MHQIPKVADTDAFFVGLLVGGIPNEEENHLRSEIRLVLSESFKKNQKCVW